MAGKCGAVGALMVGGRVVGQVVCELDAGHDVTLPASAIGGAFLPTVPGTPHAMTLTWAPEIDGPDLDLLDPAERFDTDVPFDAPRCLTCNGALVDVGTGASGPSYVHRESTPVTRSHSARA
jgi:hypothetical protein